MNTRLFFSRGLQFTLLLVPTLLTLFAQQAAKPSVNLSGVWVIESRSPNFRGPQSEWSTEKLPFTPKGLEVFLANKPGKGPRQAPPAFGNDPIGGANPYGLYRTLIYFRPMEVVQLPNKVIQMFEVGKNWRTIYTDGRPVPADVAGGPYWFGYSVGKWEGDTLVVNTLALDGRAWFDEWGTPMTDDMKVEERWQRTAPDKLELKITVTEPSLYTKPWTSSPISYKLQRHGEPEEIIFAPMDESAFNEKIRNPAGTPKK